MWRDEIAKLNVPDLDEELWRLLAQIPEGCVTTYGDIAHALGDRSAARWVGEALLDHPHDDSCACHRVVLKTGEIGRYFSGDPDDKVRCLERESIRIDAGRVDLAKYGFVDFVSEQPLRRLLELQNRVAESISLKPYNEEPEEVAGVDISYNGREAVAAYAVVDYGSRKLIRSSIVRCPARFPYIPGYLSFRELPVLLELLSDVAEQETPAKVVLVDGNGILHHRRAGIAAHLGAITGLRTLGVGKSLLCGRVDVEGLTSGTSAPVVFEEDVVGSAVVNTAKSRPIFVSPGNRIDVGSAVRVVRGCFANHRVPEPIFWADRLSRQAIQDT